VNRARSIVIVLALLACASPPARAQELPRSATPRGVIVAFLTETCSPLADVDRALFRERLAGELAGVDPSSYRAAVPAGARVRIDSIPDANTRDARRAVAYVTVTSREEAENSYIFLRRDSIWRIEAIRRLVPAEQRAKLRAAITALDTSIASFRLRRDDLVHLLLSDDSLAALLRRNLEPVDRTFAKLKGTERWTGFPLGEVDLALADEYRELDDDVPAGERIFYQIDRRVLERLKLAVGVRAIERDPGYPGLIFLRGASLDRSHYGYLYSPAGGTLPALSDRDFVVLRPVSTGWWLYKKIDPTTTQN
jgi:hypothetical protein